MSGITIPTLDEISGHTVMAKLRSLCKRFIGLAQEVDEKIDAPLEEAHQAVQTANLASANAQQSVESANQAVQTANLASENANTASESAQESAETVAGYNTRLTEVENGKLNIIDVNNYAVGLTGNQDVGGQKNMIIPIDGGYRVVNEQLNTYGTDEYVRIFRSQNYSQAHLMIYATQPNNGLGLVDLMIGGSDQFDRSYMISGHGVFNNGCKFYAVQVAGYMELWIKRISGIGRVSVIVTHCTTQFQTTNIVAGTGLTTVPSVGDINPITNETITGIREIAWL